MITIIQNGENITDANNILIPVYDYGFTPGIISKMKATFKGLGKLVSNAERNGQGIYWGEYDGKRIGVWIVPSKFPKNDRDRSVDLLADELRKGAICLAPFPKDLLDLEDLIRLLRLRVCEDKVHLDLYHPTKTY